MFEKRTWKAREVQYPGKRILTDTETGDTSSVFVTRDEGTVTEMGDSFSAANMNDLEQRISGGFADAASFSETPELTGGTWFDGKPIWRVSKYYPNVTFGGVGNWTTVGVLPIDVHSAEITLLDFDMRLMHSGIFTNGSLCVGYRLPIMGNNGYIATPWLGDGTNVTFNWVNASTSARPFDKCDVLVIIHYTRNE